jgi:hypothetical protein
VSRPSTPEWLKALLWDRDKGICQMCGQPVEDRSQAQFNHQPPLWLRRRIFVWKETRPEHYIPNAHDPDHIFTVHSSATSEEKCHDQQTHGNGLYRGDVKESARVKRILDKRRNPPKKIAWAKGRKLKSRGFQGHRKFDGTIVWRNPKGS